MTTLFLRYHLTAGDSSHINIFLKSDNLGIQGALLLYGLYNTCSEQSGAWTNSLRQRGSSVGFMMAHYRVLLETNDDDHHNHLPFFRDGEERESESCVCVTYYYSMMPSSPLFLYLYLSWVPWLIIQSRTRSCLTVIKIDNAGIRRGEHSSVCRYDRNL